MKQIKLKELEKTLEHMEYYNKMAPFPVFDTEGVSELKLKIKIMKEKEEDYDDEPVFACKYCKSLYVVNDELENSHCYKCGSINTLIEYQNINHYLKEREDEE